jgi:hypothetical protein
MRTKSVFAVMSGVVALALGLTVLGCNINGDDDNTRSGNTDPKSITISNFTDTYTGEWQVFLVPSTTISDQSEIVAALQITPTEGTLSGPLLIPGPDSTTAWTGNGEYYVFLIPRQPNDHPDVNRYLSKVKWPFTQAMISIVFTDNFEVKDITQ